MSIWCNLHQFAQKNIIYSNSPLPWRPCGAPAVVQRIDAKSGDRTQHWGWFVLNCFFFLLKIIIKLKQSQESKFHAEVTKLTLKKMTFEEWFFFKGAKKGKLHKDQFLRMTKICVINGGLENEIGDLRSVNSIFLKPFVLSLPDFIVKFNSLCNFGNWNPHLILQCSRCESNPILGRYFLPCIKLKKGKQKKIHTDTQTQIQTKYFFRVSHSYTPYTGRRQRGCDSSRLL